MIKNNTLKGEKLLGIYREHLSLTMQHIVQILAIHVFPMRQKELIYCLDQMGEKDCNGKRFSGQSIQDLIKELERLEMILKAPGSVSCNTLIKPHALADAVLSGKFTSMAKIVLDLTGFEAGILKMMDGRAQGFDRNLQISLFVHDDPKMILSLWQNAQFYIPVDFNEKPPLLTLLNQPFNPALFKTMSHEIQAHILPIMFAEADIRLDDCRDFSEYAVEFYCSQKGMEKQKTRLLEFLLLCGRFKEYDTILMTIPEDCYEHMVFQGMRSLVYNEDTALPWFNKALSLLKKQTRKRKIFLPGLPGLMFLFALLKTKDPGQYQIALAHIETALKKQEMYSIPIDRIAYLFKMFEAKESVIEAESSRYDKIEIKNFKIRFFFILIMAWRNHENAKRHLNELKQIHQKAADSGFLWLAAESAMLLADLGNDPDTNIEYAKSAHSNWGTASLVNMIPQIPVWEKILTALTHISQSNNTSPGDKTGNPDQRMIWLLSYFERANSVEITPRLQKLTKKETWTKGRAVALKNLHENFETMDWLTGQDKKICKAIKADSFQSGYSSDYYNYAQTSYRFDMDKALEALVGHPLIYADEEIQTQVEIIEGEPELRLKNEKGQLRMTMDATPLINGNNTCLVRETPTRFKLIKFSQHHQQIAALIGKDGLALPQKAKEHALKAAAALASCVQVNSDFAIPGNEHAKSVIADPTPHVHIMPFQDGISVEFMVRPFTDSGSYFKPGQGGIHVFSQKEDEKLTAQRDLAKEKECLEEIVRLCPAMEYISPVDNQWQAGEPEQALELLCDLKNCENKAILEWPKGEKLKIASQVSFDSLNLKIQKDREWFKASGCLKLDNDLVLDLAQLMELLSKATGRFLPLDENTFVTLTKSLKNSLDELKTYSAPHGNGVRIPPLAAPAMEDLIDLAGHLESDKAWKDHCKKLKQSISPELPGTLRASLRDYQKTGFDWLAHLIHWEVGGCLADDMGIGKTVQALSAILMVADQGPVLVVAPLSVMSNWQEECQRFAPTLHPKIFGPGDRDLFLDALGPFDLVIASYGLLQTEADKLAGINWQTIVLDEAQAIKNMKTKRSKAAMKLNARFRLITTGTPVENHLDELWTLFNFINPGLLGSFKRFREQFVLPIERDNDKEALRRLRRLVRPFILRRLKTDVLTELPEKTEITLYVEMNPEEASLYEAQRLKSLENIEMSSDTAGARHLKILAELTRLRRLCCNPALVFPEANIESSKLKVFADTVNELLANQHKALVFSQFVGHLEILKAYLDKQKICYQYLDGTTPAEERQKRILAFQKGQGDLFLISLKAGGAGLNLTAADYVIHMDPWWNPAVEDQASDRVHRIGQTRPVTIYRLVVKGSIEEKIIGLHREKRELAENLLAGSDAAARISADELLELLKK
ncbi:DEAD/DEAH box helicase [Desulfobacter sp.]|uniref:DEAD/DEAH box helicase n=1 Tax=Desulfobacter sp. TaxID=2294 RepID=UPI003D0CCAFA